VGGDALVVKVHKPGSVGAGFLGLQRQGDLRGYHVYACAQNKVKHSEMRGNEGHIHVEALLHDSDYEANVFPDSDTEPSRFRELRRAQKRQHSSRLVTHGYRGEPQFQECFILWVPHQSMPYPAPCGKQDAAGCG
jgi:hypothetical protein